MAGAITLPFWPAAHQCLQWSVDDQIAISGQDQVAVSFPNLDPSGPNKSIDRSTVVFKTNNFTNEERIQLERLLSWRNFSVGEELSNRVVTALAWSPQGLGSHRRCVLAVLTSNHVLSIWDSNTRQQIGEGWRRVLTINHLIQAYYESNSQGTRTPSHDYESLVLDEEAKQVRQRITAFAWGQHLCSASLLSWGEHMLAVSTEAGDILLLSVRSSIHESEPCGSHWSARVIHILSCKLSTQSLVKDHGLFSNPRPSATDLTWSAWACQDAKWTSHLAYIWKGRIFDATIEYVSENGSVEGGIITSSTVCLSSEISNCSGPLYFRPFSHQLIAIAMDQVHCYDLSEQDPRTIKTYVQALDDHWDEVTSISVMHDVAVIVSQCTASSAQSTKFRLPELETVGRGTSAWQQAIIESKESYSTLQNLAGNVNERVWGAAASPFGDSIATCLTVHPSDSIAYIIQSDQRCAINIAEGGPTTYPPAPPPLRTGKICQGRISAEALVSTARRLAQKSNDVIDSALSGGNVVSFDAVRTIGENCWQATMGPIREFEPLVSEKTSIDLLRTMIFLTTPELRAGRAEYLGSLVREFSRPDEQLSLRMVGGLIEIVLSIPKTVYSLDKPSSILYQIFSRCKAKINGRNIITSTVDHLETCSICNKAIVFESVNWAACEAGHDYSRCTLSLLSIQHSEAAKRCSLCNSPYLSDKGIARLSGSGESPEITTEGTVDTSDGANTSGRRLTLIQLLFAACDTCLYCGGKFTI